MSLKTYIICAVLVMFGIGAVLMYASAREPAPSALPTHAQSHAHQSGQAAAAGTGASDHFGCHRHGAVTYHCH